MDDLALVAVLAAAGVAVVLALAVTAFFLKRAELRAPGRLKPYRSWRRFVEAGALGFPRPGRASAFAGAVRSGRRARAQVDGSRIRLAVKTSRGLPTLRVRLESVLDRARQALGGPREVRTGDAPFDAAFFLETRDHLEARRLLQADLRRAIDGAFARLRLERLTLERGELSAEASIADLPPERWQEALVFLDRAATFVETKPLKVRCLGQERVAVCDRGGATRCAYCRDEVTGEEEGLVACDACRTVVHAACWSEHGACPVLGCAGAQAERGPPAREPRRD